MKNQLITLFSSFFCYLIFTTTIQAQESIFDKLDSIAIVDEKVMMPMRDGVRLASDIYRPKGAGKYPIIFSAASVAGLLVTTEAMVAEKPEPKEAMPAAPDMGGMGGMGGMGF